MFFSNTIHEVTKISSGYKCTFTFQIFRNNKEDSENKKLFRIDDTLVSLLKELVNTTTFQTLGFLFDSKYLFEPKSAWNNIEAIFMTFLQTLPKNEWKVQISPVLIRSNLTSVTFLSFEICFIEYAYFHFYSFIVLFFLFSVVIFVYFVFYVD